MRMDKNSKQVMQAGSSLVMDKQRISSNGLSQAHSSVSIKASLYLFMRVSQ